MGDKLARSPTGNKAKKKTPAKGGSTSRASRSSTERKPGKDTVFRPPAWVIGLLLLAVALFVLVLSLWQGNTGIIGGFLRPVLLTVFGMGSPLLGIWLLIYSVDLLFSREDSPRSFKGVFGFFALQTVVQLIASAAAVTRDLPLIEPGVYSLYGGWLGMWLYGLLIRLIGPVGFWLTVAILAIVTIVLFVRFPPVTIFLRFVGRQARASMPSSSQRAQMLQRGKNILQRKQVSDEQGASAANAVADTLAESADSDDAAQRRARLMSLVSSPPPEEREGSAESRTESTNMPFVPSEEPDTQPGIISSPPNRLIPDTEVVLSGSTALPVILLPQAPLSFEEEETVFSTPVIQHSPHTPPQRRETAPGDIGDLDSHSRRLPTPATPTYTNLRPQLSYGSNPAVPPYEPPPLNLLAPPNEKRGLSAAELSRNSAQLEETLDQFGVKAKVIEIHQGPAVTRYELQLAPGIRVNKVANLSDDIALSLAALGVRIEAPIPGKAAIGIEVPNREVTPVAISEIIGGREFWDAASPLTVALGKDITGAPVVADLTRMPHLLIAGTTGSGKSVCLNSMVTSILFRCTPQEVRLIMVDPKVVEMQGYNGIPHLLAPVVTDPKKAAAVLKIATREMDRRYERFAAVKVKNLQQYNHRLRTEEGEVETLPYWVIFIDELADLMMVARDDVEQSIIRLSQLARAAGIHLVLGTQRPTTDVITGIIKGNVPSRIAFAVSSGIDSRIILDTNGAEKLLGRGDMLFMPLGSYRPQRIQGAYISESEMEDIVAHVKMQGVPVYNEEILLGGDEGEDMALGNELDPLFFQAAQLVVAARGGSTSYIQRRLSVGYSRAGRLMDQLEERGVVGPSKGSKPRDVLVSSEQLEQMLKA